LKKTTVILLVVLVLAGACAALSGCGGDVSLAKKYMNEADELYQQAHARGQELQTLEEAAVPSLIGGDPAKIIAASGQIPAIEQGMDEYTTSARAARAAYQKIGTLSGVPEYKVYKDMMVASIDSLLASLATGRRLVADVKALIVKLQAGEQLNMSTVSTQLFATINEALTQAKTGRDLDTKAKAYQTQHKLTGG
jgi:hypothetical protein